MSATHHAGKIVIKIESCDASPFTAKLEKVPGSSACCHTSVTLYSFGWGGGGGGGGGGGFNGFVPQTDPDLVADLAFLPCRWQ